MRKNQKNLTAIEWQRFIHALEALAEAGMPSPTYADFVQIHRDAMDTHAGHAWGAHSMGGHDGRNFLSWHREYMAKIEARLIAINPMVTIPYWDWVTDRSAIPAALTDPADLADWQALHPGVNPPNTAEVLLPLPIMTRSVAQVLDTRSLGYVYA